MKAECEDDHAREAGRHADHPGTLIAPRSVISSTGALFVGVDTPGREGSLARPNSVKNVT
jgi:hypothetical protein